MSPNPSGSWDQCLQSIKRKIHPESFQTWFKPTTSRHLSPQKAVIEVPTSFSADWLEENYAWLIQATLEEETSWKPYLEFVVRHESDAPRGPVDFSKAPKGEPPEQGTLSFPEPQPAQHVSAYVPETQPAKPTFPLNKRYRFKHFVVGDSNEFSFTAAQAVAESPGKTAFNPLVVYGGVGLGKTHLLQAIGDFCTRNHTAQNVVYVTAEKFISDFITSIRKRDTSEFLRIYRTADMLLVDDIQFFLQTEGSQREFFHTFNTLYQNEKQIVLSSDCPPSSLKGFEERLISRFQCGLVTGIDAPDLETRIAILARKAEDRDVVLPHDVGRFLAEQIDSNIRELEGALTRLVAFSSLKGGLPLTVALAQQVLLLRPTKPAPLSISIEGILKASADFFQISADLLTGSTRKHEVTTARHVSMYLCKSLTGAPLKAIGSRFGKRDHTTVIHACRTVQRKLTEDSEFENLVNRLQNQIQEHVMA